MDEDDPQLGMPEAHANEMRKLFWHAKLSEIEKQILELWSGFNFAKPRTAEEIGRLLGLPSARVDEIRQAAMLKMAHASVHRRRPLDSDWKADGDDIKLFIFAEPDPKVVSSYDIQIVIPERIISKEILIECFFSQLDSFSEGALNWDSLYLLLTNTSKIQRKRIIVLHKDLPFLEVNEQSIYVAILGSVIDASQLDSARVVVCFPEITKPLLEFVTRL